MDLISQLKVERKIKPTHVSVTGIVPNYGRYESSLERDFMEILRFDPNVSKFVPQPIVIKYQDCNGRKRTYTPDGYIEFHHNGGLILQPILYEIKYFKDLKNKRKLLFPKFRAAKEFCIKKGWKFEIFTEKSIRTSYLVNVKFLSPYKEIMIPLEMHKFIIDRLLDFVEADINLLLHSLCYDAQNRAQIIPYIWSLICTGYIGCDLMQPLTMHSLIWVNEKE